MAKDNVFVYGSGGRDQALAMKYAESPHVKTVFIAPGNPGIDLTRQAKAGHIKRIPIKDFSNVLAFCQENDVRLADVGPEDPLSEGLVDVLTDAEIPCIGPRKEYVQLESDREFTDILLRDNGIPKPEFRVFDDPKEARKYVKGIGYQVVVKAKGLAKGKGAIVCNDKWDALQAIDKIMVEKAFGDAGNKVVIEQRMYGTEISFFAYLDNKNVLPWRVYAHDDKLAFDPNQKAGMFRFKYGHDHSGIARGMQELKIKPPGNLESMKPDEIDEYLEDKLRTLMLPNFNTGGMVCYCPHKLNSPWLTNKIIREIVNPTVNAIYEKGWNYKGVLYFGLNLDPDGNLWVYETNVRHGDPEAEVLLKKLNTDLYEIARAKWEGNLDQVKDVWNPNHYVDIAVVTGRSKHERGWYKGYPGPYGKGYQIRGLDQMDKEVSLFYAGVNTDEGRPITDGGRVLHVAASSSNSLEDAHEIAIKNAEKLYFVDHNNGDANCARFRKTIGNDYKTMFSAEDLLHIR